MRVCACVCVEGDSMLMRWSPAFAKVCVCVFGSEADLSEQATDNAYLLMCLIGEMRDG